MLLVANIQYTIKFIFFVTIKYFCDFPIDSFRIVWYHLSYPGFNCSSLVHPYQKIFAGYCQPPVKSKVWRMRPSSCRHWTHRSICHVRMIDPHDMETASKISILIPCSSLFKYWKYNVSLLSLQIFDISQADADRLRLWSRHCNKSTEEWTVSGCLTFTSKLFASHLNH